MKIEKNNNNHKYIIEFNSFFIKSNKEEDIDYFSSMIKFFLVTMLDKCKKFDTKTLIKNFKDTFFDLSLIKEKTDEAHGKVGGNKKTINFVIDNFCVTFHELLHLSTLNNKKNICGFRYNNTGTALNEGYTELLTKRYFGKEKFDSYVFELILVEVLEKIVGKENMEKYYFEMSLPDLIKDLEQYENKENIINFIKTMDVFLENDISYIEDFSEEQFLYFQEIINDICNFLSSCIKNKIKNMLMNDDPYMMKFIIELNLHYKIPYNTSDGQSYQIEFFNEKLIDEIIEITFNYKNNINQNKRN